MKEDEDGRDGPSALHFLCAALLGLFAGYGAVMFGYQVVGGMLPLVPMRPCDAASGAVPAKPGAQRDLGPRSAGGRFPLETLTLMLQKEEPCMSRKPLLTWAKHGGQVAGAAAEGSLLNWGTPFFAPRSAALFKRGRRDGAASPAAVASFTPSAVSSQAAGPLPAPAEAAADPGPENIRPLNPDPLQQAPAFTNAEFDAALRTAWSRILPDGDSPMPPPNSMPPTSPEIPAWLRSKWLLRARAAIQQGIAKTAAAAHSVYGVSAGGARLWSRVLGAPPAAASEPEGGVPLYASWDPTMPWYEQDPDAATYDALLKDVLGGPPEDDKGRHYTLPPKTLVDDGKEPSGALSEMGNSATSGDGDGGGEMVSPQGVQIAELSKVFGSSSGTAAAMKVEGRTAAGQKVLRAIYRHTLERLSGKRQEGLLLAETAFRARTAAVSAAMAASSAASAAAAGRCQLARLLASDATDAAEQALVLSNGGPIAAAAADTARNAAAVVLGCQDGIEGGQLTAASAAAQVVES